VSCQDEQSNCPESSEIRVSEDGDRLRIDQFLSNAFPEHSRSFFQRCLKRGCVLLNGHPCGQAKLVSAGDLIRIEWPEEELYELKAEEIPLDVIAEDDDILVINKPPGLVVHPAQGNLTGTLVHGLLFYDEEHFSELVDENLRPGIVHRLDKDTSGVMVVAKNAYSRRAIKRAFAEREVEKTYLALVLGEFGVVTGRIDGAIGRHPRHREKMAVVEQNGKHAGTRYRVLASTGEITLIQVRIETGRTHQIRVHFAHLLHPVLGDHLYGGRPKDAPLMPRRQMLHAWRLVFPHPRNGVMREYMAPPPADFRETLAKLGLPVVGELGAKYQREAGLEGAGPTPVPSA